MQLLRLAGSHAHDNVSVWMEPPRYMELSASVSGHAGPHIVQTFELCAAVLVAVVQSCSSTTAYMEEHMGHSVFRQVSNTLSVCNADKYSGAVCQGRGALVPRLRATPSAKLLVLPMPVLP